MQERVTCYTCKGKGYFAVQGFDGNERMECECDGGFVLIGLTDEQIAALDAVETLLDVERHINPAPVATPLPAIVHSNMTPAFFDTGVRRAFANELSISRTARESVVAVSSTSDADVSYLVTRETCECLGHAKTGRCLHRCFAIWHWWVLECDAVAAAAHVEIAVFEPIAA